MGEREKERDKNIFYLLIDSPSGHMARSEPGQDWEPRASFKSPTWALGRSSVLSWDIGRELDTKWSGLM